MDTVEIYSPQIQYPDLRKKSKYINKMITDQVKAAECIKQIFREDSGTFGGAS